MSEEHKPQEQQRPARKRRASVFSYLIILFVVALALLALSYFMQQRNLAGLDQSLDDLKQSVSAMETAQEVQQENLELRQQVEELTEAADRLTQEAASAAQERDQLQREAQALDWLWRIQQLYSTRYYTACRGLIEQLQEAGLEDALPDTSPLEGEHSAREQYQSIVDALY